MDDTLLIPEPLEPIEIEPLPIVRRIPNLGHALLFLAFAGFLLILLLFALSALGEAPASAQNGAVTLDHPILQLGVMAGTYVATLSAAWLVFPLLWHRPFLNGVQWNFAAVRTQYPRLIALGLFLGLTMALVTQFIASPKNLPVDQFFAKASTAWLITFFGAILAPIFEETAFRGFLVPAFAIAYDWIALPRTPEARLRWQTSTALTPASYIFAAVVSSLFFAGIHAQQVAHLMPALVSLFSISLVLTYVRVKTQSVACSTLVHSAYNGFIFLTVIWNTGGYRHLDRMSH